VLSRVLGAGGFGEYEATSAALVAGAIVLDAGLGTGIVRFIHDGHGVGELLGASAWIQLAACAAAALIISPIVVLAAPSGSPAWMLIAAAVVFCFVEGFGVLALGLLRGEGRTTLFLNLSLLRLGVTCAATTLGAWFGGVPGAILGFAFGGFGFALYGAGRLTSNRIASTPTVRYMLLRYGLPLMATSLMFWALNFSDRLFLRASVTSTSLGEYAANYRLPNLILVFLVGPLALAWLPTARRLAAQSDALLRSATTTWAIAFTCVSLATVALLLAAGSVIVPAAFGPEFEMNSFVVGAVGVSSWLAGLYILLATPVMLGDDTRPMAKVALCIVAVNLVVNTALIVPFGIDGAAAATALSFFALCNAIEFVSRRRSSASLPQRRILYALLIVGVTSIAAAMMAIPIATVIAVIYVAAAAFVISGARGSAIDNA
jgi:O-antigen/teichoic acid export membrane protein